MCDKSRIRVQKFRDYNDLTGPQEVEIAVVPERGMSYCFIQDLVIQQDVNDLLPRWEFVGMRECSTIFSVDEGWEGIISDLRRAFGERIEVVEGSASRAPDR